MSLRDAFRDQAGHCVALGSPFMGRLCTTLAEIWPDDSALGRKCAGWTGDIGPSGASLPLRIAGGLHALVLRQEADDLTALYPPNTPDDDVLARGLATALARHEGFLLDWIETAPQTNEVRRSTALIPAAHWIATRTGARRMQVSELGASAGLNLMWDQFAVETAQGRLGPQDPALTLSPDWTGPFPDAADVAVIDRRGVDLNPLDPHDPAQALRLCAYLWPDQPHRMELTRAAIGCHSAIVDTGDAIDWLEQRVAEPPGTALHLIYHTIAWQYFPAEAQARGNALIEAAGARATTEAPLAWLRLEADGLDAGAGLTLRLWPGNHRITLGRADFHGRWVRWEG